jgi:DNA ligase-associated metallophosphoesterase
MPLSLTDKQKHIISQRVLDNNAIPCLLAQQHLLLDALGVAFWPKQNLLIFSDLHFEKGSFLSQFANPLPQLDTLDTIKRMQACLDLFQPEQVVCLGDSLHDGNAINRMRQQYIDEINLMVSGAKKWWWILGNHDPDIPKEINGTRVPFLALERLLLVHEPENLEDFGDVNAQIIGHFHPKARRKLSKHYVRGKCFLKDEQKLMMPAFGAYTGGLDSDDPALTALLASNKSCYLSFNNKLFLV